MTAFVCLQCLGAVTLDFFPYTIGFPILLQKKTSKFPIVRPFEAAMFQDVHWLLIEHRTFFRSKRCIT